MTTARFFSDSQGLCGFFITGHSSGDENDEEGKIVCAAVSSAAYLAANTISEIVGDSVQAEVADGKMKIILNAPSETSRLILQGLALQLNELSKQYPKRITTITEV